MDARVMKSDIKAGPAVARGLEKEGEGETTRELEGRGTRANALVTSTVNLPTRKLLGPRRAEVEVVAPS